MTVRFGDQTWTGSELRDRVRRNANAQRAAGLEPGDRVVYLDRNHPTSIETTMACALAGTVNTMVNFRLSPAEMVYVINDSTARLLVVGPEFVPVIEEIRPQLSTVEKTVILGDEYEDFLGDDNSPPAYEPKSDDCFLQMYTSGTTGFPKGAMLTHRAMAAHARNTAAAVGFDSDSVVLVPMPLYHVGGMSWALSALAAKAEIVIVRDVVPDQLLARFGEDRITHAFVVPAVINFFLNVPNVESFDYSTLKAMVYGASPIPTPLLRKALATFPVDFYQVYGMTEASGLFSVLGPADHHKPELQTSAGRMVDGMELRVVDPATGEPVPDGVAGEFQVRGDQVMAGYWGRPADTAAALVDGWLRTGDVGRRDTNGYLFVEDRVKDMIISGGENVYPAEVERVLDEHPNVRESAVIGVPDPKWGETVKAVVVLSAKTDPADLIAYCGEHLAGYKRPTSVDIVAELPRNATGKVLKRELRASYHR